MKDERKSKKQLIDELVELRQRVAELETTEVRCEQAEEALQESNEQWRALYQGSPIPTYAWQRSGEDFVLMDCNAAALAITQSKIADSLGVKASKMYQDMPDVVEDLSRCFAEKISLEREMAYRLKTTGEDKYLAVKYAFVPPDLVMVRTEDITRHRLAVEALRESERRYRGLFDRIPVGLYRSTADGQLFDANPALVELAGYPNRETLLEVSVTDDIYLNPEDRQRWQLLVEQNEVVTDFEVQIRRCDGKFIWTEENATAVHDDEGSLLWYEGVVQDITERKQAEEELHRYRNYLEESVEERTARLRVSDYAIKSAISAIAISDLAGNLTYVNPAFLTMWGYEDDTEVLGRSATEFWQDKEKVERVVREVQEEETWLGELVGIRKDGVSFHAQVASSTVVDETGEPVGMMASFIDITQQVRTEEALRHSEEHYRSLFDSVPVGLYWSTPDGQILDANPALLDILGFPDLETIRAKNAADVYVDPSDRVRWQDLMDREGVVQDFEAQWRRRDGTTIWVKDSARAFRDNDNQVLYYEGATEDITERKQAEQALRRRNRELALLNRAGQALSSTLDLDQLLRKVVTDIQQSFGYYNLILLLLDQDRGELGSQTVAGGFEDLAPADYRRAVGEGLIGWATQTGESVLVNDVAQDPRYILGFGKEVPTQSELCVPLKLAGQVIGALDVQEPHLNAFDTTDLRLLETLADQIAVAIENARLYQQTLQEIAARKRMEEMLRRREQEIRTIADNVPALVSYVDADGCYRFVNKRYEEWFGVPRTEIVGKHYRQVLGDAVYERIKDHVEEALSGHRVSYEDALPYARGGARWVIAEYVPDADDEGNVNGFFALVTDISERKRAEEELRESEERYRSLFEGAEDHIFVLDQDCHYVMVNPSALKAGGFTLEDIAGRGPRELFPEDAEFYLSRYRQVFETGESIGFERKLRLPDGTHWFSVTLSPIKNAQGRVIALTGISRDITGHKQAELARIEAETYLRTVLRNAPITVFAIDNQGLFTLFEGKGLERAGYKPGENVGASALDQYGTIPFVEYSGRETTGKDVIQRVLAGETVSAINELRGVYFDNRIGPIRDTEDNVVGIVGVATDITDLKQAEETLRRRTAQLEALREIGLELTAQLDLEAVLHAVVTRAMELLDGHTCGISLYDAEQDVLKIVTNTGQAVVPVGTVFERGQNLGGTIWDTGEPLVVDRYENPRSESVSLEAPLVVAALGVPITWRPGGADAEFLGTLVVKADLPRTFSPDDVELLRLFATQAAIAIRNAQLYDAARERRRVAETLRKAATILNTSLEPDEVLRLILEQLQEVIPYDSASIQRLQGEGLHPAGGGQVGIVACRGFNKPDDVVGLTFPLVPKFPNHRVITTGTPVAIEDVTRVHVHFREQADAYRSGHIHSWLGVPLTLKDVVIGMIAVDRAEVRPFTVDEMQLATAFANHAAIAMENALLYEELQRELAERQRAEEALRVSEENYRLVSENIPVVVYSALPDEHSTNLFVSGRAQELTGYTREQFLQDSEMWPQLVHPRDRQHVWEAIEESRRGKTDLDVEYRITTRDGTLKWLRDRATPMLGEDGEILRLNGFMEDITERKLAEEALCRYAAQLEALRGTGLEIAAQLDLDTLLETIVSRAIGLLDGDAGGLYLYRPEREVLEWAVAAGSDLAPLGTVLHRGEGLSGKVWETGEVLVVDDYQTWEGRAAIYNDHPFAAIAAAPILWRDEFLGVLDVLDEPPRTFSSSDVELLTLLTTQAAIAIKNARLYEEVESGREQLRDLAGYLQNAREEERTRIAREIHDEFGQTLTALRIDLSWCAKRLPPEQTHLVEKARAMIDLIDDAIQLVRRVATELRPGLLDDLGLVAALEWQAQDFCARTGIDCDLALDDEESFVDLERDLVTAVFRVFQEALTNVARHADATQVQVTLEKKAGELILTVRDDGEGISERQVSSPRSLGLIGMRERIRAWGGEITYEGRPGEGTTVTVRVPLQQA
jgi:PAS domain S-box-containing protein